MGSDDRIRRSLPELTGPQREEAMTRFATLRPFLEEGVPLARSAAETAVPIRTARRWLARYQSDGLVGLARPVRSDTGRRRMPAELVELIEGMALRKPRPSVAAIHRRLKVIAKEKGWLMPSIRSVHSVVSDLDPALVTLAQDGAAAYRDRFEMIHRHRAGKPNAIWQADHTELDVLILDANGTAVRPWLTVVVDDHSRAVAGFTTFIGAPSALQTSLALRQAIWRKTDPAWQVCGIPDVLYVDHGSDFTSTHLEQVAADLRFAITFSTVARPQGRGKIERLFGTINTELLADLPGRLDHGRPATPPALSLPELDAAIGAFIVGDYNARKHIEIGVSPRACWIAEGWLPRMPDRLEDLDELLVMVAQSRRVRRDGIRFQGLRYTDPTLAAYVGEAVAIRYDPRDIGEIRVFHRGRFLCRAIDQEHSGQTVTLKDVQTARRARRRSLRGEINQKLSRVADFLPRRSEATPTRKADPSARPTPKLRLYYEDE